jgi:Na+-driven multidrug efflux pump
MAVAFSAAPVAGQNFGARHGERVRSTFRAAVLLETAIMAVILVLCQIAPASLIAAFTREPRLISVAASGDQLLTFAPLPAVNPAAAALPAD